MLVQRGSLLVTFLSPSPTGYDAYMTGAAFACLLRLYEASGSGGEAAAGAVAAGSAAAAAAAALPERSTESGDEEMWVGAPPSLEAVRRYKWRMNLSRCALLGFAVRLLWVHSRGWGGY